mmetsp:Transcript_22489/g.53803  ORF Transcript_22489/g.53803 Transcript_22489/m.53803 type:complete len:228 (+) Transcript_22489:121-804(+)
MNMCSVVTEVVRSAAPEGVQPVTGASLIQVQLDFICIVYHPVLVWLHHLDKPFNLLVREIILRASHRIAELLRRDPPIRRPRDLVTAELLEELCHRGSRVGQPLPCGHHLQELLKVDLPVPVLVDVVDEGLDLLPGGFDAQHHHQLHHLVLLSGPDRCSASLFRPALPPLLFPHLLLLFHLYLCRQARKLLGNRKPPARRTRCLPPSLTCERQSVELNASCGLIEPL